MFFLRQQKWQFIHKFPHIPSTLPLISPRIKKQFRWVDVKSHVNNLKCEARVMFIKSAQLIIIFFSTCIKKYVRSAMTWITISWLLFHRCRRCCLPFFTTTARWMLKKRWGGKNPADSFFSNWNAIERERERLWMKEQN